MASASSNTSTSAASKSRAKATPKPRKKATAARKPTASTKTRIPFLPGSLNDQLSKLEVGESNARCQRIPLDNGNIATINDEAQRYFKAQNSILSGGIAKVRASGDHKHKRFKMERGTYMSAGNDAMFAFLTVTRME